MFVVLHPADADEYSLERKPLLVTIGVVLLLVGLTISRILAIVLAIAFLAFLRWQRLRNARKWKGWEAWPATESTVEFVKVQEVRRRRQPSTFIAELAYSYKVQSDFYSGFCRCAFQDEKEAWAFVEAHRDKQIPVHYNPDTPDISIMSGTDL